MNGVLVFVFNRDSHRYPFSGAILWRREMFSDVFPHGFVYSFIYDVCPHRASFLDTFIANLRRMLAPLCSEERIGVSRADLE